MIRILEEALPARFGGRPTSYQLVEEEASDGRPALLLPADPSLGPLDEGAAAEGLLTALGDGPAPAASMAQMWRDSNTLQIVRRAPMVSRAGKILHLHAGKHRVTS